MTNPNYKLEVLNMIDRLQRVILQSHFPSFSSPVLHGICVDPWRLRGSRKKQLYLRGQRRDWDPSLEEPIAEQIKMMSLKP
jgi:hypothetical protein